MATKLGIMSAAVAAAAMISVAGAEESPGRISSWNAGPVFKSDGWELKIGGRAHLDYSIVDTDTSGARWRAGELRRLRLGVSGKFGGNVKYKFELHTDSSGELDLEDGFVQWAPTGGDWNFKAGHFKTPNSLEEQTSSLFISVLERAAFTDAFEFNRRLGIGVSTKRDNYTLSAGVFGENVNEVNLQGGYALAARGTFTPINRGDLLIHLGASVRYRRIGDRRSDLRYRQRPVSHIPGRIISTGPIADSDVFVGAEAAAIAQNFWAAGEYGVTFADCSAAAIAATVCDGNPTLSGAYGEVGVIFGGKKTYHGGRFSRPKVDNPVTKGGMGALALVARFDTIDLTDTHVSGGSLDSYIVGADWWATNNARLSVNFFKVDAGLGISTSGLDANFAALVTAGAPEEGVTGVMFRAQIDF